MLDGGPSLALGRVAKLEDGKRDSISIIVTMREGGNFKDFEEPEMKHLEFIQNTINRMGTNSFYVKGWSVTLVSATFALTFTMSNALLTLIAFLPAVAFWILDASYLREERLFRRLYDAVRSNPDDVDTFSMDTSPYKTKVKSTTETAASKSLRYFHGAIVVVVLLASVLRYLTA